MRFVGVIVAWLVSVVVANLAAVALITERVIAEQKAVGAEYNAAEALEAFALNLPGIVSGGYGIAIGIALLVAFPVAALVKRVLRPLAPIAYPVAGAAAVVGVLMLINQFAAPPGVGGAIPGARSTLELALQALAGGLGGLVFEIMRPKSR